MKTTYDLSTLNWTLSGFIPDLWRLDKSMEIGASPQAEIPAIPAPVPGSVQKALIDAEIIPDWNMGTDSRLSEWVENRHWIYEVKLPDEWFAAKANRRLFCNGLDYKGWIYLNGQLIADFKGSHTPLSHDLDDHLQPTGNVLRIVFDHSPRWLGQFGYTSRIKEWKTRFNYTWDWVVRQVQIGISGRIVIEESTQGELKEVQITCHTDAASQKGSVRVDGYSTSGSTCIIRAFLTKNDITVATSQAMVAEFNETGLLFRDLDVDLWWPNLDGEQPLYELTLALVDRAGNTLDRYTRNIGFREVTWGACEGAAENADPWICHVNGKPVFLQGANWVPVLPCYADVTYEQYRKLLELYKDLGVNILRVWGGATIEHKWFYDICDELGIMVWQEFPMSSSGVDNWPPEEQSAIDEMAEIARSYIQRRKHHVSLIIWCGGNELQAPDKPCDDSHPMLERLKSIVEEMDPGRRWLATSATGPTFYANPADFGKGVHWDVHGPWKAEGRLEDEWYGYWEKDDALFRSETGAPGCMSADMIRQYSGGIDPMPISWENPLWRRTSVWWIETDAFKLEQGRDPETLEEYVEWSQTRQKNALAAAAKACKKRFPKCGGFIVWMGHDCFPCTANTAIIDFHCQPKPAALALKDIFHTRPDQL